MPESLFMYWSVIRPGGAELVGTLPYPYGIPLGCCCIMAGEGALLPAMGCCSGWPYPGGGIGPWEVTEGG